MSTEFCPTCRQVMTVTRNGVRMSKFKATLFDLIKRRGSTGITNEEINQFMYDGKAKAVTIRAHIWQLNELLYGTGLRISGRGSRAKGFYHGNYVVHDLKPGDNGDSGRVNHI